MAPKGLNQQTEVYSLTKRPRRDERCKGRGKDVEEGGEGIGKIGGEPTEKCMGEG